MEDGIEIDDLSNQYDFFVNNSTDRQIYGSTKFDSMKNIILSVIDKRNNNNYLVKIEAK